MALRNERTYAPAGNGIEQRHLTDLEAPPIQLRGDLERQQAAKRQPDARRPSSGSRRSNRVGVRSGSTNPRDHGRLARGLGLEPSHLTLGEDAENGAREAVGEPPCRAARRPGGRMGRPSAPIQCTTLAARSAASPPESRAAESSARRTTSTAGSRCRSSLQLLDEPDRHHRIAAEREEVIVDRDRAAAQDGFPDGQKLRSRSSRAPPSLDETTGPSSPRAPAGACNESLPFGVSGKTSSPTKRRNHVVREQSLRGGRAARRTPRAEAPQGTAAPGTQ